MKTIEDGRGSLRSFKSIVSTGLCFLAASAFFVTGLAADDQSLDFAEEYVGVWCGEGDGQRWRRVVTNDGRYTQSNHSLTNAEEIYEPHVEAGSWSIEERTLLTQLHSIQYEGEEPRLLEPNWELEFQILVLNSEELVLRYDELNLTFTSTRNCSVS